MAPWADDVTLPERGTRRHEDPADGEVYGQPLSRSESVTESAVRHAMPDHQGLGPAWRRRLGDRDPLDDRLEDERRADEGWRAVPMLEDGYW